MLVKYDVTFYKGDQIPIFMFKMDHENDFVEQFVISLFQSNQCKQIKLEFRIDEADLYMNDYKGYEFRMKANEHFKVNLVFCSTKSKVDKEYYVGYAHVTEVIK